MTKRFNSTIIEQSSGTGGDVAFGRTSSWGDIAAKCTFAYVVFVFTMFTSAPKMFGLVLPTTAVVYLGGVVLILFQARALLSKPLMLVVVMIFPLVAFASTWWGVDPEVTVRHSVQLMFTTLLAASIGAALRPHQLMLAMAIAFGTLIFLSVANLWLQVVPAYQQKFYLQGNEYFTGIFTHKNVLGAVICMGSLCFAYLIIKQTPRWPFVILLLSVLPVLVFARSTTSLVLYAFILTMPFLYLLVRQRSMRLIIILGLLCCGIAFVMLLEIFELSLIDIGLELAGKGRDMSGRTSLWAIALERFSERPWLGVGYQSFWTAEQFTTDVDWVHGFLEDSVNHFHNAWLEALVGLGIVGAIAMAVTPIALICVLLPRLFGKHCSPIDIAGIYFSVLVLVRSNLEVSFYYQHQSDSVALTSLLVSVWIYHRSSAGSAIDKASATTTDSVLHVIPAQTYGRTSNVDL